MTQNNISLLIKILEMRYCITFLNLAVELKWIHFLRAVEGNIEYTQVENTLQIPQYELITHHQLGVCYPPLLPQNKSRKDMRTWEIYQTVTQGANIQSGAFQ